MLRQKDTLHTTKMLEGIGKMKAHEILSDESKWTKGAMARDSDEYECCETGAIACKWCILGSLFVAYPLPAERWSADDALTKKLGVPIHDWNDDPKTTFQDVRTLLLELDL